MSDRPRRIPPADLSVEVVIEPTDGELGDCSSLRPSQCKVTYRPFPRGERLEVTQWEERELHHRDMEARREKK
eukprot:5161427-Alexandrium_andersonii.AAC.1